MMTPSWTVIDDNLHPSLQKPSLELEENILSSTARLSKPKCSTCTPSPSCGNCETQSNTSSCTGSNACSKQTLDYGSRKQDKYNCPYFGCSKRVDAFSIASHFKQDHPENYLMGKNIEFPLPDAGVQENIVFVTEYKTQVFVILLSIDENFVNVDVFKANLHSDNEEWAYLVNILSKDISVQFGKVAITKNLSEIENTAVNASFKVDRGSLLKTMNVDQTNIIMRINIFETQATNDNDFARKKCYNKYEACVIPMENLEYSTTISNQLSDCAQHYSLCQKCKYKMSTNCHLCGETIKLKENFILEDLLFTFFIFVLFMLGFLFL